MGERCSRLNHIVVNACRFVSGHICVDRSAGNLEGAVPVNAAFCALADIVRGTLSDCRNRTAVYRNIVCAAQ